MCSSRLFRAGSTIYTLRMLQLPELLCAYGRPDFTDIFKQVIENLDIRYLPLQQGLSKSGYVTENPISVMVLSYSDKTESILVKAGIFYTGIIAGCSCADDPSPVNEENEYCEIEVVIDKDTANVSIRLLTD